METQELDYETLFNQDTRSVNKPKQVEQKPKEVDETRKGQIKDMMNPYSLGTTIVRIIPDKHMVDGQLKPRCQRKVLRVFDGAIKDNNNTIFFRVPDLSEYTEVSKLQLTKEQVLLLNDIRNKLNYISGFVAYGKNYPAVKNLVPKLRYIPQVVLSYGKLLRYIDANGNVSTSPEIGYVRILKFTKGSISDGADYLSKLNSSIQSKYGAIGTMNWLKDYFSRDTGTFDKAMCINVNKGKNYTLSVAFEQVKPFEITQDDINLVGDLNSVYVDTSAFPDEFYNDLKDKLDVIVKVCDSIGA